MFKILLKAAILVFIILSVYFIVNPSACSNLMVGRVVHSTDKEPVISEAPDNRQELLVPVGDNGQPLAPVKAGNGQLPPPQDTVQPADPSATENTPAKPALEVGISAVPSATNYSQEEIDYAIASRYVELENEYAKKNKVNKDSAIEISYQVIDDFQLTPQEWEAFLQRATQTNLFNQVRADMSVRK